MKLKFLKQIRLPNLNNLTFSRQYGNIEYRLKTVGKEVNMNNRQSYAAVKNNDKITAK